MGVTDCNRNLSLSAAGSDNTRYVLIHNTNTIRVIHNTCTAVSRLYYRIILPYFVLCISPIFSPLHTISWCSLPGAMKHDHQTFRSPTAHDARSPPRGKPAPARLLASAIPHHSTHPTRPRAALHEPSRARSAPCTQLPMPSPADSSTLRTATSAFTQHNLHSHRTSPRLCASPPPGLCPPTPARGSAPPPPSRRPALPVNLCAICSAHTNVLTLRERSQRVQYTSAR